MGSEPDRAELAQVAARWIQAPRGAKTAIADELAAARGVSRATAYQWLRGFKVQRMTRSGAVKGRKTRADKGCSALSEQEARVISAAWVETVRANDKGRAPLHVIVDTLRDNGLVTAARVDPDGVLTPLSESALHRALRTYGYHPDQLSGDRPATELRSPHPNWCWQIDASLSRQYYLGAAGTEEMDKLRFYRGKPENFQRIASRRIWRYVVTDHCSGALEVLYVQGAESQANLITALIHAMSQRADGTMHGVPRYLMTDPGSGMTGQTTRNFLDALGIEALVNEVGNARAKGQVENGNWLVETYFESTLRFRAPVVSIAELNGLAQLWCRDFNARMVHTRTQMTRRDGWLRITPAQLQMAPALDVLLQLPNTSPKSCRVRNLQIRFDGRKFDLRQLPGIGCLAHVQVLANVFEPDTVRVLVPGDDGHQQHYIAAAIDLDDWGKSVHAPIVGQAFRSAPETPAQARTKELERLAMGAATDAEAKQRRRKKQLAFGGAIDPQAGVQQRAASIPTAVPRAGAPSEVTAAPVAEPTPIVPIERPRCEARPLDLIPMVMELKRRLEARGGTWEARHYEMATARWPQGVLEEQLDACVLALMAPTLKAMSGGAA